MLCQLPNGTFITVTWKLFAPQCTQAQIASKNCPTTGTAYVAAITICGQRLI